MVYGDLSTPSLGITHYGSIFREVGEAKDFQLPLSGSRDHYPGYRWKEAEEVSEAFNSLSRDHSSDANKVFVVG